MTLRVNEQKIKKKIRKECRGNHEADAGDVFPEGLNDSSCHDIAFNYLKELEAKAVKINEAASSTKESWIKREKQLEDFTSLFDYFAKKFDEYKDKRKRIDKRVKCLEERVSFLENKMVK